MFVTQKSAAKIQQNLHICKYMCDFLAFVLVFLGKISFFGLSFSSAVSLRSGLLVAAFAAFFPFPFNLSPLLSGFLPELFWLFSPILPLC